MLRLHRRCCCCVAATRGAGGMRGSAARPAGAPPPLGRHQMFGLALLGAGRAPLRGGSAAAPAAARAAAAVAGAADGPPEAPPMHRGRCVRFCMGHSQPIVWMGGRCGLPMVRGRDRRSSADLAPPRKQIEPGTARPMRKVRACEAEHQPLGAGRAPLRGGSAASPAAARAAAAVAGAADGPPEATPVHGGRRARFCVGHSQPIFWMGALGCPTVSMTRSAAHQRTQRCHASSESRADHARFARCGLAKQSRQRWGRRAHRCRQQLQQPLGRARRAQAVLKTLPSPPLRMGAGAPVSVWVTPSPLSGWGRCGAPHGSMTRSELISGPSATTQAARAGCSEQDAQGAG